jgi:hypothetical protein
MSHGSGSPAGYLFSEMVLWWTCSARRSASGRPMPTCLLDSIHSRSGAASGSCTWYSPGSLLCECLPKEKSRGRSKTGKEFQEGHQFWLFLFALSFFQCFGPLSRIWLQTDGKKFFHLLWYQPLKPFWLKENDRATLMCSWIQTMLGVARRKAGASEDNASTLGCLSIIVTFYKSGLSIVGERTGENKAPIRS